MYLCYLDESGVPEIPGNSTHFVLSGVAIPIERWREADASISAIMSRFGLADAELHTAWLLRKYLEQSRIPEFDSLDWHQRRTEVQKARVAEIFRVRKFGNSKRNASLKNFYRHTEPYTHLTFDERRYLASSIAQEVSQWEWARLFACCIDKRHFELTPVHPAQPGSDQVNKHAFLRVLTRFAGFLEMAEELSYSPASPDFREFGLLIHDSNPTVATKHTNLMRLLRGRAPEQNLGRFLERIIETPLFVDSSLTRMVQVADLCAYSLRRYVENQELDLFNAIFEPRDTKGPRMQVSIGRIFLRHLSSDDCGCLICNTGPK